MEHLQNEALRKNATLAVKFSEIDRGREVFLESPMGSASGS